MNFERSSTRVGAIALEHSYYERKHGSVGPAAKMVAGVVKISFEMLTVSRAVEGSLAHCEVVESAVVVITISSVGV